MKHGWARIRPYSAAAATRGATVPMCVLCAGYPLVLGPLVGTGLLGSGVYLHGFIPALAPINLWLLRGSWREHRDPLPLILAVASLPFIFTHLFGHFVLGDGGFLLPLIWAGGGLLIAALAADWRAMRSATCATAQGYWQALLNGTHGGLRRGRQLFGRLPADPRCKLCNAPFSAPFGPVMRLIGKAPSAKNPNFCTECLTKTPIGGAEVEVSLLFADVRGSTTLAESLSPLQFATEMNRFYTAGTAALIETDALIDKFMGDEVIGIYTPGFAGVDHARLAVAGALELLRATDPTGLAIPIGVGVHTGIAYVGTVGSADSVSDITVLGDAANVTARLASAAGEGEILVSAATCVAAGLHLDELECRTLELKGRSEPVVAAVLRVAPKRGDVMGDAPGELAGTSPVTTRLPSAARPS